MSNDLMLDVGQANELKLAFRRANFTNRDIKSLTKGDVLTRVLWVLRGDAEVKWIDEHVIDCSAKPFVPRGWAVEMHQGTEALVWDKELQENTLYLPLRTRIDGFVLYEEFQDKGVPVLNANVLDYLLAHPHLIPEEWKIGFYYFWGTIYRYVDNLPCVRCLLWSGSTWESSFCWLHIPFGENSLAVIRAR